MLRRRRLPPCEPQPASSRRQRRATPKRERFSYSRRRTIPANENRYHLADARPLTPRGRSTRSRDPGAGLRHGGARRAVVEYLGSSTAAARHRRSSTAFAAAAARSGSRASTGCSTARRAAARAARRDRRRGRPFRARPPGRRTITTISSATTAARSSRSRIPARAGARARREPPRRGMDAHEVVLHGDCGDCRAPAVEAAASL